MANGTYVEEKAIHPLFLLLIVFCFFDTFRVMAECKVPCPIQPIAINDGEFNLDISVDNFGNSLCDCTITGGKILIVGDSAVDYIDTFQLHHHVILEVYYDCHGIKRTSAYATGLFNSSAKAIAKDYYLKEVVAKSGAFSIIKSESLLDTQVEPTWKAMAHAQNTMAALLNDKTFVYTYGGSPAGGNNGTLNTLFPPFILQSLVQSGLVTAQTGKVPYVVNCRDMAAIIYSFISGAAKTALGQMPPPSCCVQLCKCNYYENACLSATPNTGNTQIACLDRTRPLLELDPYSGLYFPKQADLYIKCSEVSAQDENVCGSKPNTAEGFISCSTD